MKKIVIEVQEVFEGSKCLRIKEQTERDSKFGSDHSDFFTASNGFVLHSRGNPEVKDDKFFVRGYGTSRDGDICIVPTEAWLQKLRLAVREYNIRFADRPVDTNSSGGIEIIQ